MINIAAKVNTLAVSSGGIVFKDAALGANGHRFELRKRSKLFPEINFSSHNIVGGSSR